MARKKSVLLVSKDGATFVLEEADEFDREVAELGSSEKFMRFLRKRSREKAVTSIEEFAEELTARRIRRACSRRRCRRIRAVQRSPRLAKNARLGAAEAQCR